MSTDEPETTVDPPLASSVLSTSFYQRDSNDPILVHFPTVHFTSQSHRYSPFNFTTIDRISPSSSSSNTSVNGFFTDIRPKDRVSLPRRQSSVEHVSQAPPVSIPADHGSRPRTPISPPSPRDQTSNTFEFPIYRPIAPRTPPSIVADEAPKFRKLEFSMAAGLQWNDASSE